MDRLQHRCVPGLILYRIPGPLRWIDLCMVSDHIKQYMNYTISQQNGTHSYLMLHRLHGSRSIGIPIRQSYDTHLIELVSQ